MEAIREQNVDEVQKILQNTQNVKQVINYHENDFTNP